MKQIISTGLSFLLAFSLNSCVFAKNAEVSPQSLIINGEYQQPAVYSIDESNYFKIRDVAYFMNFGVEYDAETNSVLISPDTPYQGSAPDKNNSTTSYEASESEQSIYINNEKQHNISVYNINGNNYFKIRDLADAVDFGCKYNKIYNCIELCSDFGYNSADVWGKAKASDILKVTYIDVGQGDSILIEFPSDGGEMLIDAGTAKCENHLLDYLENEITDGVIEYVIATHPHADHIGSMLAVVKNFDVETYFDSRLSHTSKTYKNLATFLAGKNLGTKFITGDTVNITDDISFTFLGPVKNYSDLNNSSTVIRLNYGDNVFLFTGDAESDAESEILNSGADVKADVVKVGHHGSHTSSSQKFVNAVDAEYAVASLGIDNTYGHPAQEVVNRWQSSNAIFLSTAQNSDIVITSDGNNIKAYPAKPYN